MKKVLLLFTIIFMFTINVYASNDIYSINMNINIDRDGNATFVEEWDVKADDGSEWYRRYNDLGNSKVTNFKVSMDGIPLTEKNWNINDSLEQKKGYFGTNKIDDGIELCFGKGDYERHSFTLSYNISNIIFNTNDSQVLYWRLLEQLDSINVQKFDAKITGYYAFPSDLDVYSTGYEGLNYVQDGVIKLTNICSFLH